MKEKIIGIYKIENKLTGKFYIGSSKNIQRRWSAHKSAANKKELDLYKDMRELGIENFIFSVIEECKEDELRIKEQYYIDSLKPSYNKVKASTGIAISADVNFNEYHRLYLETQEKYNKEHKEYCREWYKAHKEYFKKYYSDHKKK